MNAIAEIGILVFREGLECILVLAAVTAGFKGAEKKYQPPIWAGVGIAFVATLITWFIAVHILDDISQKVSALSIQAATRQFGQATSKTAKAPPRQHSGA